MEDSRSPSPSDPAFAPAGSALALVGLKAERRAVLKLSAEAWALPLPVADPDADAGNPRTAAQTVQVLA